MKPNTDRLGLSDATQRQGKCLHKTFRQWCMLGKTFRQTHKEVEHALPRPKSRERLDEINLYRRS